MVLWSQRTSDALETARGGASGQRAMLEVSELTVPGVPFRNRFTASDKGCWQF